MNDSLTVEEAKAETVRIERAIAEAIPSEQVDRVEQAETGVLLSCGPDRQYQWTGRAKVYASTSFPGEQVLQDLAENVDGTDGLTAEFTTEGGRPEALVHGQNGQVFVAAIWDDGARIEIASGSQCFKLPNDADPRDEY